MQSRKTRRLFLRAAGASLAVPYLPSLISRSWIRQSNASENDSSGNKRHKTSENAVRRFCCIYFPNGVSLPPASHPAHRDWHWFPHKTGADYELNRPLEPLSSLRSEFSVLSGLSHPATRNMVGHATGDTFLTGADQSNGYANSISVDQFYASVIAAQTRFPSLTLSSDGGVGTPGRAKTMSFTASGKPIPSLSSPREIFNRLFGVTIRTREQQRRQFGNERSILDNVRDEARAIQRQLNPSDQRRLEEYLTSVREIEVRLSRADHWLDVQKPQVDADGFKLNATPGEGGEDYIRVILDLMYTALLTDSTRSMTYQITSEDAKGIGDNFPNVIGLKGHHNLSHSTGTKNGYEEWARYDQFLAKQLAYFLNRLRSSHDPEGEGTLLDNTIVLYGCGTSRTHEAVNYPLIVAGGKNMNLAHGHFRQFDESRFRMSDLFVTLLQRLSVDAERFADSTKTIDDVLA